MLNPISSCANSTVELLFSRVKGSRLSINQRDKERLRKAGDIPDRLSWAIIAKALYMDHFGAIQEISLELHRLRVMSQYLVILLTNWTVTPIGLHAAGGSENARVLSRVGSENARVLVV